MNFEEIRIFKHLDEIITSFGGKEGFYLLDSGSAELPRGRFSYAGIHPDFTVFQDGARLFLKKDGSTREIEGDIFSFLKKFVKNRKKGYFPFNGGFIGYLTYDFGWLVEAMKKATLKKIEPPICYAKFNYYSEIIIYDHLEDRFYYLWEDEKKYFDELKKFYKKELKAETYTMPVELKSVFTKDSYRDAIKKTKKYIEAGDIYQANISQRFETQLSINPSTFYMKLRHISPAPFGAYLKDDNIAILCNSPERFIFKKGRYIETCPIKGTRKRFKELKKDRLSKKELKNSIKDRAEHIMIVDLERNDLGKICKTGSVKVKKMFSIETYANVHHMVSTVYGRLKKGVHIADCLKATFPGGSITGAPKIRAMEIIEEIEPFNRGIYCGSIGYIDLSGDADFNIAIRTGVMTGNRLYFYVGGGIVADSDPDLEYEETITKARAFLSVLDLMELKD